MTVLRILPEQLQGLGNGFVPLTNTPNKCTSVFIRKKFLFDVMNAEFDQILGELADPNLTSSLFTPQAACVRGARFSRPRRSPLGVHGRPARRLGSRQATCAWPWMTNLTDGFTDSFVAACIISAQNCTNRGQFTDNHQARVASFSLATASPGVANPASTWGALHATLTGLTCRHCSLEPQQHSCSTASAALHACSFMAHGSTDFYLGMLDMIGCISGSSTPRPRRCYSRTVMSIPRNSGSQVRWQGTLSVFPTNDRASYRSAWPALGQPSRTSVLCICLHSICTISEYECTLSSVSSSRFSTRIYQHGQD